jgi:hypothetical protein
MIIQNDYFTAPSTIRRVMNCRIDVKGGNYEMVVLEALPFCFRNIRTFCQFQFE